MGERLCVRVTVKRWRGASGFGMHDSVRGELAADDPTLPETVQMVGHCLELCREGQEKVREG